MSTTVIVQIGPSGITVRILDYCLGLCRQSHGDVNAANTSDVLEMLSALFVFWLGRRHAGLLLAGDSGQGAG